MPDWLEVARYVRASPSGSAKFAETSTLIARPSVSVWFGMLPTVTGARFRDSVPTRSMIQLPSLWRRATSVRLLLEMLMLLPLVRKPNVALPFALTVSV